MSLPTGYERVTARRRCPVCGKPDWCLIKRDGTYSVCPRVSTNSERETAAGFLHKLSSTDAPAFESGFRSFAPKPATDMSEQARRFCERLESGQLIAHAESLGVSAASLRAIGIGWSKLDNAYTFPMHAANGMIHGIRFRDEHGCKWAVRGSQNGLFLPERFRHDGPVVVCEGPTDTAAMLDLGFDAIGRSFCRGEIDATIAVIRRERRECVILSDLDGPGVEGARALATAMGNARVYGRIVLPMVGKDARAWKQAGATHEQVLRVISNAAHWKAA